MSGKGSLSAVSGDQVTFTPEANWNGTATFTYKANDGALDSEPVSVTITVDAVNDAPVAVADSMTTNEDTTATYDVITNDTDIDNDNTDLTVISVTQPDHVTVTIDADGRSLKAVPSANWNGTETFDYTMKDTDGLTSTATVTLVVSSVNDAPKAVADSKTTNEDTAVSINVLANDSDVDLTTNPLEEALTVSISNNAAHGTAEVDADNIVTYTPSLNYFGSDSFEYTLTDASGATATATVKMTVISVNDAPTATNLGATYTTNEDESISVTFDINDTETTNDALMLQYTSSNQTLLPDARISLSGMGNLTSSRTLTLNPAANKNGTTTITLRLSDGQLVSTYTFTLTVSAVNDAPVAVSDTINYTEDTSVVIDMDNLVSNDTDIEITGEEVGAGTLAFVSYSDLSEGTLTLLDDAAHTYTFTPLANSNHNVTFKYTIVDGGGLTATGTVTLKCNAVNDAPSIVMTDGYPTDTDEDTPSGAISFTISDVETAAASLIVTAGCDDEDLIQDGGLAITRNSDGTCSLIVTPNADQHGSCNIEITVSDGNLTATQTIPFTINSIEDIPVAIDDAYSIPENTTLSVDLKNNDYDRDKDLLSIVKINGTDIASGGTVDIGDATVTLNADGTITFLPDESTEGLVSFSYTISDAGKHQITAHAAVTVNAINDAPVLSPIADLIFDEDTTGTANFTMTDPDLSDTHTYTVSSSDQSILNDSNIVLDESAGTLQLTPEANANGTLTVTLTVKDSGNLTSTQTFSVTVRAINDAPVPDSSLANVSVTEDTPKDINLVSGVTDVENDTIHAILIASPSHGTIINLGSGSYRYTPYANYNGSDSFDYSITDGNCVVQSTVMISVTAVDDAPIAYDDYIDYTTASDSYVISVLANDTDYDLAYGDSISLDASGSIVTQPSYGTVVVSVIDGTITYTSNGDMPTEYDSFTYRMKDSDGTWSNTATVHIARDDAHNTFNPYTSGIHETILEDSGAHSYTISIFDPDTAQNAFIISALTYPSLGTASYTSSTRTLVYTPNANANGTDTFTYQVTDSIGRIIIGTVQIVILPVDDAPVISAVSDQTILEDHQTDTISLTLTDADDALSALSFSVYSNNETLLPIGSITKTYNSATGQATIVIKPDKDQNGSATVTILASDGISASSETFTLTVASVNDAPVANDYTISTNEEVPVSFDLITDTSDVDNTPDQLSIQITQNPDVSSGTATASGRQVIFTPAVNYFGDATLKYTLSDGTLTSEEKTVTIHVINVNDDPVISGLNYVQTTNEDTTKTITINVSDVDNDTISLTAKSSNTALIPDANITITGSGDTRTITLVPTANNSGVSDITLTIGDGTVNVDYQFELTVVSVNDLPTAQDTTVSTDEDHSVTFSVTSLIGDIETSVANLHIVALSAPSHGTVTTDGSGSITYKPNANWNGTETFTYTIADEGNAKATATVTVDVAPVNDAPTAAMDYRTMIEDGAPITINVLANDSDIENDTLTVTAYSAPTKGTIEIQSNGVIVYTPNKNANGREQFVYTLSDGSLTSTGQIIIDITPVNDAPSCVETSTLNGGYFEFNEDTVGAFNLTISDPETAISNLIITVTSGDQTLVKNADIRYSGSTTAKTVTMTPLENKNGTFVLHVIISDGVNTTTQDYNIRIISVNDAPVIADAAATTNEDTAVSGAVSATDVETPASGMSYTLKTDGAHGTAVVSNNGSWTYTPSANYNGTDSFVITASDNDPEGALTADSTVTITVTPKNDAPVANNDTGTTPEHTAITVNVLDNDTDADLSDAASTEAITILSVTQGTHGSVTISADLKTVTYQPNSHWDGTNLTDSANHWYGTDTFSYTIQDTHGATSQATVRVDVTNVNDPPVAVNDTASLSEDGTTLIDVLLNDTDVDSTLNTSETKTIFSVSDPTHGTAVIESGKVRYTPDTNWYGTETFSYTMQDAAGSQKTADITVTVAAVNDAPTISGITGPITVNEDTSTGALSFTVGDVEDSAGTLTVTLSATSKATLIDSSRLTFTNSGATRTVSILPKANQNGTATLTLTVKDSGNLTSTMTFTVNVTAINDAPVANNDSGTTPEDVSKVINVLSNDTDVDTGDSPNVETKVIDSFTQPTHGAVTLDALGLKYTPNANWFGTDSFTYTMKDAAGSAKTATVTMTVTSVNDVPIAVADSATTDEDHAIDIAVITNDTDNDLGNVPLTENLTVKSVTSASHGTVAIKSDGLNKTVTYTPTANYNGTDSFTYTVQDAAGATSTATVSMTVNAINDNPVANPDSVACYEDSYVAFDPLGNDTDVDFSDSPSIETKIIDSYTQPSHGTVTADVLGLKYTPTANYNGSDSFSYTMKDSGGLTATATVSVTVNPVNDAPIITGITGPISIDESTSTGTLNFTVSDVEDAANLLTVTEASSNTALIDSSCMTLGGTGTNRTIVITPFTYKNGTSVITLTVTDTDGLSSTLNFTMHVGAVDNAPVAVADSGTLNEDTSIDLNVVSNDTDIDFSDDHSTETLSIQSINTTGAHGTAVIKTGSDGKEITYTPNANWSGTDVIHYTVVDSSGLTSTASVTFTVSPIADSPDAANDTAALDEDGTVLIDVLANDTDADIPYDADEALSIESFTQPSHGSVTLVGTKLQYIPNANWNGTETFTYTVKDTLGHTDTATVSVTVAPVNDLPTITPIAPITINEDSSTGKLAFTVGDVEDNSWQLSVSAQSSNPSLIDAENIDLSGLFADRTITVSPKTNRYGTAVITLTVKDTSGGTSSVSFTVTVNSVNDTPVAVSDAAATNESTSVTVNVLANDTDADLGIDGNDSLSIASVTQPANGSVSISGGRVIYTPSDKWFGTDSFTYTITDSYGARSSAKVTVTVYEVKPIIPPTITDTPIIDNGTKDKKTVTDIVNDVVNNSDTYILTKDTNYGDGDWIKSSDTEYLINNISQEGVWHLYTQKDGVVTETEYIVDYTPPLAGNSIKWLFICDKVNLNIYDATSGVSKIVDANGKEIDPDHFYVWKNGTYTVTIYDNVGNSSEYTFKATGIIPWWVVALCLLGIGWLIIFWKRQIYYTDDQPGEGVYFCMHCKTDHTILDDEQKLPKCTNCGRERFRKRKTKKVKK